jgi:antitoxin MazE
MHVTIRKIGNSHGIVIPKPMLLEAGLHDEAELTVEDGALVLRPRRRSARAGWAESAARIAESGDDALVLGEFANAEDEDLAW